MQFKAKTKEQLNEESLIPEKTICDFEVIEGLDTKSKRTGADMIKVKLKVFHGEGFKLIDDYLMESMPHKLLHFCEATDQMEAYQAGTLSGPDLKGAAGKVEIKVDPAGEYPAKNSVKDYIGTKRAEKMAAAKPVEAPAGKKADDDDCPF